MEYKVDFSASKRKRGHVLVISFAGQAHIATSFRLAKALAERGVTVTFATRQEYILSIKSIQSVEKLQKKKCLNLVGVADHEDSSNLFEKVKRMKLAFQPYFQELLNNQRKGLPGPTCIMADRFLLWTKDIAEELEIPRYVFFSNCALEARLRQAGHELQAKGKLRIVDGKAQGLEELVKVPGFEFMRVKDLPWFMWAHPEEYLAVGESLLGAEGVILNTFSELEDSVIRSFQNAWLGDPEVKVPKVFCVGPLSTATSCEDFSIVDAPNDTGKHCLNWLDNRSPASVLYICFGTVFRLDAKQAQELALALENSQQSFLWVVPLSERNTLQDYLPADYEERLSGRAMIVTGWVPQAQLLAHKAIFGFLSHCGWSSTLESISAGVPILAWPLSADQNLTCRYVVSVLRIAIEMTDKRGDVLFASIAEEVTGQELDVFVEQSDIERAINLLMVEQQGQDKRARAQQLKRKATAAIAVNGSSYATLQELAELMNLYIV